MKDSSPIETTVKTAFEPHQQFIEALHAEAITASRTGNCHGCGAHSTDLSPKNGLLFCPTCKETNPRSRAEREFLSQNFGI